MRAVLQKVEGVSDVEVDFATKKATITMAPGKVLTTEDVSKAFEGTNYTVGNFEAPAS